MTLESRTMCELAGHEMILLCMDSALILAVGLKTIWKPSLC